MGAQGDFEEANLSEQEEETGGGAPKKNECDRYSDLRASHTGSQIRKRERINSDQVSGRSNNDTQNSNNGGEAFSDSV